MAERAALVTGGSSGIGLAIARMLGEQGYGLTVSARRPDKLEDAVKGLTDAGIDAHAVAANMGDEEGVKQVVDAHRDRFGRMDVLINNAGVGIGGAIADHETKKLDMQIDVNLRGVYLTLRESIPLLKEAGAEHGKALVINTASIAGKFGQGWLLGPGFVATAMTDWVEGQVPKDQMIQPGDIAEAVRFLLATSPACIVPEIQFIRPGDTQVRT
jgi:NAD(P)-dependent dehydrogenase (short-subunit alcohol dehydrogenase family)